jgi:hypothetical protein
LFSEEVTAASATNTVNYVLSGGGLQSAFGPTGTPSSQTGLLAAGFHVLTINGIQDMACQPTQFERKPTLLSPRRPSPSLLGLAPRPGHAAAWSNFTAPTT